MKIKIIYATESGTTKFVAETIKKTLEGLNHEVVLHCLNFDGLEPEVVGHDIVLFGSPTYDDGQPQAEMVKFIYKFNKDLSQTRIGIFALGENWYPHYCEAAEVLEKWVLDHAGKLIIAPLKVDGYPLDTTEITTWAKSVVQ